MVGTPNLVMVGTPNLVMAGTPNLVMAGTPNYATKQFVLLIKLIQPNILLLLIIGMWTQRDVPCQPQNTLPLRINSIRKFFETCQKTLWQFQSKKAEQKMLPSKWLHFKPICLTPSVFCLSGFQQIFKRDIQPITFRRGVYNMSIVIIQCVCLVNINLHWT